MSQNEGGELEIVEGHISIRNVSFSYPTRPGALVLDNLSLELEAGRVCISSIPWLAILYEAGM